MSHKKIELTILTLLISFSLYCSYTVGATWDEFYHHKNGDSIFKYIFSLGKREYQSVNFIYHYGLYDFLSTFFSKNFSKNYIVEAHHVFNSLFSILSVFGVYQICKKLFNSKIGKISFIICFLNPVYFGHFSINPKDTIIAFCYVWILNISIKYINCKNLIKKRNNYLIYLILLLSLGLSIRLTFIVSLLPIFSIIVFELIYNKSKNNNSIFKFIIDSLIIILFSFIITIIFWPDTHSNILVSPFIYIKEYFISFMGSNFSLPVGLLDGEFYTTVDTPMSYIFISLFHKMPIYMLFSFLFLPLIFFDKNFIKQNNILIKNFLYIFLQIVFVFSLILIFKPGINDGIRYFLYIIPLIVMISSLCIYYVFKLKLIFFKYFIILLFTFNLLTFVKLTPYQYIFINNLSGKFSNNLNKYENDYWGASLKELILKAKQENLFSDDKVYNFATCGLNSQVLKYYLKKYINNKFKFVDPSEKYDFIIFINRVDSTVVHNLNTAKTCYSAFHKNSLITVNRNNLPISFISN